MCLWSKNRNYNSFPLPPNSLSTFLMNIKTNDESILKKHDELIKKALLYGDEKFDLSCHKFITSSTMESMFLLKDLVIH